MKFFEENAHVIIVVLLAIIIVQLFMNRKAESFQDAMSIGGRGMVGRGLDITHYMSGCPPL